MARPVGKNFVARIINRELIIDNQIQKLRRDDLSFNMSEIDNMLWREYLKIHGTDPNIAEQELQKEEEDIKARLIVIETQKQAIKEKKDKMTEDEIKKFKDQYKGFRFKG